MYGAIVCDGDVYSRAGSSAAPGCRKKRLGFSVLRKIGNKRREVHLLVLKQLGVWFGMPITAAIVVAIIVIGYFLQSVSAEISAYIGCGALMVQVGLSLVLVFLLLICYFISTWILFKRFSYSEN
ncbi:MAG: hypothetical protein V8S36_01595 [Lachnospiraceae bacterium]